MWALAELLAMFVMLKLALWGLRRFVRYWSNLG